MPTLLHEFLRCRTTPAILYITLAIVFFAVPFDARCSLVPGFCNTSDEHDGDEHDGDEQANEQIAESAFHIPNFRPSG
jgi:hypothetical protein